VTLTANIQYGEADFYDANSNHDLAPLYFDFYEPHGDTLSKRPLVLTLFGGAFLGGNKEWDDMKAWCDSLSRYGYACASIQYRLLFNPLSTQSMIRASYRAVQDTRAAIRFLMEYASDYRIDTNKIFIIGNSAGSITALHTVFISKESERPASTYGVGMASDQDDLGCLDCSGNSFAHQIKLAGIIPLWVGVWDIDWLEAEEGVPSLLIHGTGDGTVPYDTGYAFGLTFTPFVYGSVPIDRRMGELGIPHEFHPFDSLWHSFYMSESLVFPNEYWEPVFTLGHQFLYKVMSNTFTGMKGIAASRNEISIFPNPADDKLYLNFNQELPYPVHISLTTITGVNIKSWQLLLGKQPLDISNVPAGIYFIRIRMGQQEFVEKVMVN